jgi:AraC family transcriptional regulator of adaptative response/methylated-DNA-[protein]-cysteine methyltransferase
VTAPGADVPIASLSWCSSPVGPLILGATRDAVCRLEFADEDRLEARLAALRERYAATLDKDDSVLLQRLRAQLAEYFAGARKRFDAPLAYAGSGFQRQVWAALCDIPYGETWSYLDVARRLGDPLATRAVGAANGMNPIAIVIPCHRVVNADGKLGGYGGGLWRKRILLDLELGQGTLSLS